MSLQPGVTQTSSTLTRSVGFIGAGKVGTALARHLIAAGDRVLLAGSGDPFLTQLVADTVAPGAEAVWPAEAAASDVVVLALPLGRIAELDPAWFDGRIVVDATNHWESVDGHIDGLHDDAAGTSAWIARQLPGARIVNTAPLDLDAIIAECRAANDAGLDVARLHSGDLSLWSAMGEQLRRLRAEGIPVAVTPGVPAFAAAAAALEVELTLPGLAQSVVLTRTPGRASAMPPGETLAAFAATGATLAVHLSIHVLDRVVAELTPAYGPDCPAAVVYRASWPDQRVIRATLATLQAALGDAAIERTALILVGPALAAEDFATSRLYAPDYDRRFRPGRAEEGRADG